MQSVQFHASVFSLNEDFDRDSELEILPTKRMTQRVI